MNALVRRAGEIVAAVAALSLASQVTIPLEPVPVTLQTLAVTLAGALLGARRGALAVLVWLTLAAFGLPLLADGGSGIETFGGPSGGYLFAFPVAAAGVGLLAERGWDGRRPQLALAAMLAGNAICLLVGWSWLAAHIGMADAWAGGVRPFLPGALAKSAAGAAILWGIARSGISPSAMRA